MTAITLKLIFPMHLSKNISKIKQLSFLQWHTTFIVLAHPAIDVLFFHQLLEELEKPRKENLAGKGGKAKRSCNIAWFNQQLTRVNKGRESQKLHESRNSGPKSGWVNAIHQNEIEIFCSFLSFSEWWMKGALGAGGRYKNWD